MMEEVNKKSREESGMGNVKYREVKRAAKVGEKIRAVDARPMWTPHYENGDEFEVVKTRTYGILGRRIGGDDEKIKSRLYNLCDSEYVVLEPETKITEYRQVKKKERGGGGKKYKFIPSLI
ncbi:hypothetical protein [Paenibacillus larvae]|uniref:hypothetical protein n=1 Tax=Paenibacillus larvae TaxID=1464 RepID=UPI00288FD821|nr:hypothetical protein [Paenibacillus larvae]MDT2232917.1 hypothetical protein [Paenibacillus larvae]